MVSIVILIGHPQLTIANNCHSYLQVELPPAVTDAIGPVCQRGSPGMFSMGAMLYKSFEISHLLKKIVNIYFRGHQSYDICFT